MTRLIISADAERDLDEILDYLTNNAGGVTAAAYAERFTRSIERIITHPGAGSPRPALGKNTRITIVYPYILIYDFTFEKETATLLRVLHGKREFSERLIKGAK